MDGLRQNVYMVQGRIAFETRNKKVNMETYEIYAEIWTHQSLQSSVEYKKVQILLLRTNNCKYDICDLA